MAWVEGELERTFEVLAPFDDVVKFFCNPSVFKAAFDDLESAEEVEPMVWKWILEEKSEKGVTFQGQYIVEYTRRNDELFWSTREGNVRSEGHTQVKRLGEQRTEVVYREKMATDLPIPKLMAKVFKPIVAREIKRGVGSFLDNGKRILEQQAA